MLATSVAALQCQAGAHGKEEYREETGPDLDWGRQWKINRRSYPRRIGAPHRRQMPREMVTSPPSNRNTEDRTLSQQATLGVNNQAMAALPDIFVVLMGEVATLRARLELLATLPLEERPPWMVPLKELEPHIQVLWGLQYVTPSYASANTEDGRLIAFVRDTRGGHLPMNTKISLEWIEINSCQETTVDSLNNTLDTPSPRGLPG